jgi:hypothetical protein
MLPPDCSERACLFFVDSSISSIPPPRITPLVHAGKALESQDFRSFVIASDSKNHAAISCPAVQLSQQTHCNRPLGVIPIGVISVTAGTIDIASSPDFSAPLRCARNDNRKLHVKTESVIGKLESMKLSNAAATIREGIEETLSCYYFPRENWRRIKGKLVLCPLLRRHPDPSNEPAQLPHR